MGLAGGEESKAFFFEKKKQKTFIPPLVRRPDLSGSSDALQQRTGVKVFWSFFTKKDCFLPESYRLTTYNNTPCTAFGAIRPASFAQSSVAPG